MRDRVDDLHVLLDSIEKWLVQTDTRRTSAAERALAKSLAAYVRTCRRRQAKRRSVPSAERAIRKVNAAWSELVGRQFRRR